MICLRAPRYWSQICLTGVKSVLTVQGEEPGDGAWRVTAGFKLWALVTASSLSERQVGRVARATAPGGGTARAPGIARRGYVVWSTKKVQTAASGVGGGSGSAVEDQEGVCSCRWGQVELAAATGRDRVAAGPAGPKR